ncbi:MAG: sugar ABC transporter permease [Clostridiales bacterium]|nr:sugar ABC transporter permease [Clostridiales bacterium]
MRIKTENKRSKTNKIIATARRDLPAWLLIVPFLLCALITIWLPTAKGIIWSFFDMNGYTVGEFAGLKNYIQVFTNTDFIQTVLNTFKYVFWSILIGFWLPAFIAILLNEIRRGSGYFKFAIYFPAMVPAVAVSLLWYYIYFPDATGLLNMILLKLGMESMAWLQNANITIILIVITSTWCAMGSTMLIYYSALQNINRDLYEAALLDGAGFIKRIWHVTLPQISGMLLINFVGQVITVFQIFEQPLAMTGGGPNNASMSLGLLSYKYAFQDYKVGNSLATNMIMLVMLIIFTVFYFSLEKKTDNTL